MILREVAVHHFAVYAVCGLPNEGCEVENFLRQHWDDYPRSMRDLNSMLREWTPQQGPPFDVEERAKKLRERICEFRAREKKKTQVPRILFFEDDTVVVCTNAFLKKSSTPDSEISRAIDIREQYFRHKESQLVIVRGWGLP